MYRALQLEKVHRHKVNVCATNFCLLQKHYTQQCVPSPSIDVAFMCVLNVYHNVKLRCTI